MTTWEVSLFQFEAKIEDSKHLGASLYRILQGRNSSWGIRDETTPGSPQQHHTLPLQKPNFTNWGHIPLPTNTAINLKLKIWCTQPTSNNIKQKLKRNLN